MSPRAQHHFGSAEGQIFLTYKTVTCSHSCGAWSFWSTGQLVRPPGSASFLHELVKLVAKSCGSCHGDGRGQLIPAPFNKIALDHHIGHIHQACFIEAAHPTYPSQSSKL